MVEVKYAPGYNPNNTEFVVLHHSGGLGNNALASTQDRSADHINNAHKARWNFKSTLGMYGGYNFFIDKNGKVTQFRAIGEETAANRGFNYNGRAISICLAGNFSEGVDTPTFEQESALINLSRVLPGVDLLDYIPHRHLQWTQCYGSSLKDDYFRRLLTQDYQRQIAEIELLLARLVDFVTRRRIGTLGSAAEDCNEADVRH